MRFIRLGFILVIVCSALGACRGALDCFSEDVFCAGLVTDTLGIEDHGVNQDAWAALQNAKANGSADQVAYIESLDTRDYEKNIAYFAEHGYDVIVTAGIGLRDETQRGADLYEKIFFIAINQPQKKTEARANLIPVTFAEDQMGFVAGMVAARITKTGSVGAVCEDSDIDSMWRYCEGFRAGAKFADEDVKSLIVYRNNGESEKLFLDEEWGYDTAESLIIRGADVIFAAGGITGQGALHAAIEFHAKAIGSERDQAAALGSIADPWVVTSVYGDTQLEVEHLMQVLKSGNKSGLGTGRIKFSPLGPKFPENLTGEINETLIKLWNLEIKTNVTIMKP